MSQTDGPGCSTMSQTDLWRRVCWGDGGGGAGGGLFTRRWVSVRLSPACHTLATGVTGGLWAGLLDNVPDRRLAQGLLGGWGGGGGGGGGGGVHTALGVRAPLSCLSQLHTAVGVTGGLWAGLRDKVPVALIGPPRLTGR